jgi:hypothetical protein
MPIAMPPASKRMLLDDSTSARTGERDDELQVVVGEPINAAPPALTSIERLAMDATPTRPMAMTMAGTSMMASSAGA